MVSVHWAAGTEGTVGLLMSAGSAPRVGLALSALTVFVLAASALAKLSVRSGEGLQTIQRFGYPPGTIARVALVEVLCVALYVAPWTSMLGAILITAYLGGAVATHVRISDPRFLLPIVLGICAWGGLYLRDDRLSLLLPMAR